MRILIADDHPLYLEAAGRQLSAAFNSAEILKSRSFAEVQSVISQENLALVLLDYGMPDSTGLPGIRSIANSINGTPLIVMSGVAPASEASAFIQAGAKAFLPKTLEGPLFISIVKKVLGGETYLPGDERAEGIDGANTELLRELSDCEIVVLRMVMHGASNKEIARTLNRREVTVKFHLNRIFRKLGIKNRSQATALAMRAGLS